MKRISVPTRIGAAFFLAPAVMVLASGPALAADSILISNTETVQAHLNADGSVQDARVYEQVALQGNGTVTIKDPDAPPTRGPNSAPTSDKDMLERVMAGETK